MKKGEILRVSPRGELVASLLEAGATIEIEGDQPIFREPKFGISRKVRRSCWPALRRVASGTWRQDLEEWPAWRIALFRYFADRLTIPDLRCSYVLAATSEIKPFPVRQKPLVEGAEQPAPSMVNVGNIYVRAARSCSRQYEVVAQFGEFVVVCYNTKHKREFREGCFLAWSEDLAHSMRVIPSNWESKWEMDEPNEMPHSLGKAREVDVLHLDNQALALMHEIDRLFNSTPDGERLCSAFDLISMANTMANLSAQIRCAVDAASKGGS